MAARLAKDRAGAEPPAGRAVDRTSVVEQSLGASDFGGIAKLAEAMLKLTPSGQEQLLIGAVVFAAIAAVLGGVDTVSGR
jgi:hypothetical protein